MRLSAYFLAICVLDLTISAQAPPTGPVVNPRGIVNAFTQQPAPSQVAAGGLIWIEGLNLGPASGVAATAPWPSKLGDAGLEVLINGKNAPVGYISAGKIIAQVPFGTATGLATLAVRTGQATSQPSHFQVMAGVLPSIRTADDSGYGDPLVSGDSTWILTVSGLGETDPKLASGDAGPADSPAVPTTPIRAYVGGVPVNVAATASTARVGEFDVKVDIPPTATPGDMIDIVAGARAANIVTYKRAAANASLLYLPLPSGAPEIRDVISSDLRGTFVAASGPRDAQGCYTGYVFDFAARKSSLADPCLTAANRNAATPFVQSNEGTALAAFIGPPDNETPGMPVSAKVKVFNPVLDGPLMAQLPSSASNVLSITEGNFAALVPGTPATAFSIDSNSGSVQQLDSLAGIGGAAAGGAVAGGAGLALLNLKLDPGNGLTHILSAPVGFGQGSLAIVVGDDADTPKNAKVAILNAQGEVTSTRDFPAGWLPLVAPAAAAVAGAPGAAGRGVALRVTTLYDASTRLYYVVSRKADASGDGFILFASDGSSKIAAFPSGWFAASCTSTVSVLSLPLTRQLALFGSKTADTQVKRPCPAFGFLIAGYGSQTVNAIEVPGQGQINATANAGELNGYVYATNIDPLKNNAADTLFVLDTISGVANRFDPPSNVATIANLTEVAPLNSLIGIASTGGRIAGDAGIIVFNFDQNQTQLLNTPDGFSAVQFLEANNARNSVFENTRKLVVRGSKTDGSGSQLLIFDLLTQNLQMPPNPDGVAFIGGPPQAATPGGGAGGGAAQPAAVLLRSNTKANTVTAVGYSADKKQVGLVVLRVP
jgi:uncharacterized protein (TIGR03437 family)